MSTSRRSPFPYDCVLHGTGLMLADDGGLAWRERRLESLPPPISGPARAYAQFPSEHEAAWTSGDLTGGYGASTALAEGGRRYAHGFVDARFPNQVMLPPALTESPTSADGTVRGHFELGGVLYALVGSAVYQSTDGARWTLAHRFADGVTPVSAAVFQGAAAAPHAFVAVGGGPGDGPYWTFDGAAWTPHPGVQAKPTAVLVTTDGGVTYTDQTESAEVHLSGWAAGAAWLLLGSDAPFDSVRLDPRERINRRAATLRAEFWTGAGWEPVSGWVDRTIVESATLGRAGAGEFTEPVTWRPSRIEGIQAFWLRLSATATLDGRTRLHAIAVHQPRKADRFLLVGDALLRASSEVGVPRISRSVDGGGAATWTSGETVGGPGQTVTALASLGDRPYAVKSDGLFRIRPSGEAAFEASWPRPAALRGRSDGRGGAVWRGALWLPSKEGLYRFAPGGFELVGPETLPDNDSPVRGRITACAGDAFFLYAALRSDRGATYLLCYDAERGAWHPLADLGRRECRHMWVSGVPGPNPRLYLGLDGDLGVIILPRHTANPLHDPRCRFAASGELRLSRFHGSPAARRTAFLGLNIDGARLGPDAFVDAAYRLDGHGAYAPLGRFATASGQRVDFGSAVAGTSIDLRLRLTTHSDGATPVIRAVSLAYAARTGFRRVFDFRVRLADQLSLRDGGRDRRAARDIKRALMAAAASELPVVLTTPDGEALEVLVREAEVRATGRPLAWAMHISATEYRQTAAHGRHRRLATYRHDHLAAYTHRQISQL